MSEPIQRSRRFLGLILLSGLACLVSGCWRLNLQPTTGSDTRLFSVADPLPDEPVLKTAQQEPRPPEVLFEEPLPTLQRPAKQKYLPPE